MKTDKIDSLLALLDEDNPLIDFELFGKTLEEALEQVEENGEIRETAIQKIKEGQ